MFLGIRPPKTYRGISYDSNDEAIDLDAEISALPDDLRRVLVAEFVISGTVKAKVGAAGMSAPTYYRKLKQAKRSIGMP